MSYEFYKLMHFLGMFVLFGSIGATAIHMLNGGTRDSNASRKFISTSHGVALLLILVSGLGMLAKHKLGMPGWIHPKLLIWLLLGGLLALPYKVPGAAKAVWVLAPLLGATAAFLALYKPF